MYKYYSTQRPVSPGTFPGKPIEIHNFDKRVDTGLPHIGPAWGWLIYSDRLTPQQADSYELVDESAISYIIN